MAFSDLADQIRSLQLKITALVQRVAAAQPAGSISAYAGSDIPDGWLLCDGATIARVQYPALFAAIGITYGLGNGTTTFRLPNLAGRVIVARDPSQNEFAALGKTGGAKTHTLTLGEMPQHTHGQQVTANEGGPAGRIDYTRDGAGWSYPQGTTTEAAGGSQPHNNLQPFLTLAYIIKT